MSRLERYPSWQTLLRCLTACALAGCSTNEPQVFPRPFHVLAHRGASALAPENTLESCRKALEMGVLEVEIDVQLSKDGKVVLFHDTTLEDKLGRPGGIHDYTWAELRELEIGTWFHRSHPYVKEDFRGTRLVTLEGLLAALGPRLLYHIELKSQEEELPSRVLEVVRRAKLSGRVSLSSFQMEQLVRGHAIDTDIPIDYLVGNAGSLGVDRTADSSGEALFAAQREQIDAARRAGFGMVALPLQDLSREIVAYAHGHGLLIRAWKIRSDEDMDHAIALGTNGMTTNWPNRLIRRQLEHLAGHSHQERQ